MGLFAMSTGLWHCNWLRWVLSLRVGEMRGWGQEDSPEASWGRKAVSQRKAAAVSRSSSVGKNT